MLNQHLKDLLNLLLASKETVHSICKQSVAILWCVAIAIARKVIEHGL